MPWARTLSLPEDQVRVAGSGSSAAFPSFSGGGDSVQVFNEILTALTLNTFQLPLSFLGVAILVINSGGGDGCPMCWTSLLQSQP